MLLFLREIGAMADTLVLLPLSTLTLLSALMFSAETAVVIGAVILPISPPTRAPPAARTRQ